MSWGVDFESNIFLSHQDYQGNKYLVKEAIEDRQADIIQAESSLRMLASSNPKDVTPEDWDSPIEWIYSETETLFESLKEAHVSMCKLQLYLEHLEEKESIKQL